MNSIDRSSQAIQNAKVLIEESNFSLTKGRDLLNRSELLLFDLQILVENRELVIEKMKDTLGRN